MNKSVKTYKLSEILKGWPKEKVEVDESTLQETPPAIASLIASIGFNHARSNCDKTVYLDVDRMAKIIGDIYYRGSVQDEIAKALAARLPEILKEVE